MANSENYDSYTVLEMFQLLTILKKDPFPGLDLEKIYEEFVAAIPALEGQEQKE